MRILLRLLGLGLLVLGICDVFGRGGVFHYAPGPAVASGAMLIASTYWVGPASLSFFKPSKQTLWVGGSILWIVGLLWLVSRL